MKSKQAQGQKIMSSQAQTRNTTHTSKRALPICLTGFVSLLCCAAPAVLPAEETSLNDPKAIVQRTENVYKSAKFYHGTLTLEEAGKDRAGVDFTFKTVQDLRFAAPNRFVLRITSEGTGSAKNLPHLNQVKASDGMTLTVYDGTKNQYYHRPALKELTVYRIFERAMPRTDTPGLTLQASVNVNGHAAYVIQAPIKIPAVPVTGQTPAQTRNAELLKNAVPPHFAIDHRDFHLLQVASKVGTVAQTILLENQTIDSPLSADALAFEPPANAKQVAPGGLTKP